MEELRCVNVLIIRSFPSKSQQTPPCRHACHFSFQLRGARAHNTALSLPVTTVTRSQAAWDWLREGASLNAGRIMRERETERENKLSESLTVYAINLPSYSWWCVTKKLILYSLLIKTDLNWTQFSQKYHSLPGTEIFLSACAYIYLVTWIVGAPAELVGSLTVPPAHPGISVAFWSDYEPHPTETNA